MICVGASRSFVVVEPHTTLSTSVPGIFLQTLHRPWVQASFSWPTPSLRTPSGNTAEIPPPTCVLGCGWPSFRRQIVTSLLKFRWDSGVSSIAQCARQAATIVILRALMNSGQYHFLPLIIGRYDDKRRSMRSTPPMPLLYRWIRCGCVTWVSGTFFTLLLTWWRGRWPSQLLATETTELSFHLQMYTLPSER